MITVAGRVGVAVGRGVEVCPLRRKRVSCACPPGTCVEPASPATRTARMPRNIRALKMRPSESMMRCFVTEFVTLSPAKIVTQLTLECAGRASDDGALVYVSKVYVSKTNWFHLDYPKRCRACHRNSNRHANPQFALQRNRTHAKRSATGIGPGAQNSTRGCCRARANRSPGVHCAHGKEMFRRVG